MKMIEEQWKEFERMVLHSVDDETRDFARKMFYAGVQCALVMLGEPARELSRYEFTELMNRVEDEVMALKEELEAKLGGRPVG